MDFATDSNVIPFGQHKKGDEFEAVDIEFDHSNEVWAESCLAYVRLAASFLKLDKPLLEKAVGRLLARDAEHFTETLDNLGRTSEHLKSLADLIDVALARIAVVQDQVDKPPPTSA